MVKNSGGGNRAKRFARKDTGVKPSTKLRLSDDPDEIYACVTKLHGNTCDVITIDGTKLTGHIRGSMSGKKKRFCLISANTIILAGMRSWESVNKHCDILEVYTPLEVDQLRNIPKVNLDRLNQYMTEGNGTSKQDESDITFSSAAGKCSEEEISSSEVDTKNTEKFAMEETDIIDIDDI